MTILQFFLWSLLKVIVVTVVLLMAVAYTVLLERKLVGKRKNSHMGALIDLVLAHPIASAGLIAKELGVTPRAAQNLVAELGLREATGRGRYRAWGIL